MALNPRCFICEIPAFRISVPKPLFRSSSLVMYKHTKKAASSLSGPDPYSFSLGKNLA